MNGAETTQQLWSTDEFGGRWTLGPEDLALLAGLPDAGKLGLAAQLAYGRQHGRFPDDEADLAPAVIGHLAVQVDVGAAALDGNDWTGRTGRRHRRLVRDHLAVAAFDDAAEAGLRRRLAGELLPREPAPAALEAEIGGRPPSPRQQVWVLSIARRLRLRPEVLAPYTRARV